MLFLSMVFLFNRNQSESIGSQRVACCPPPATGDPRTTRRVAGASHPTAHRPAAPRLRPHARGRGYGTRRRRRRSRTARLLARALKTALLIDFPPATPMPATARRRAGRGGERDPRERAAPRERVAARPEPHRAPAFRRDRLLASPAGLGRCRGGRCGGRAAEPPPRRRRRRRRRL